MTWTLSNATLKISSEFYDYMIFHTLEEYDQAGLKPLRYDLDRKYVPKKAAVIVVVPPLASGPDAPGSLSTMTGRALCSLVRLISEI